MAVLSQKKYLVRLVTWVILLLIGFGIGYKIKPSQIIPTKVIRENTNYTFIHPLLAVNRIDIGQPTAEYIDLTKKIRGFINDKINSHIIDTASVYFINYNKEGYFIINGDEQYAPASLLKVVVMIGYLKKADTDPSVLTQQFTYTENVSKDINSTTFESPTTLAVGSSYTVETLINKMIIDSDNGAMNLLLAHITDTYLYQCYADLGLKSPEPNTMYTTSVKDYSLFFRILYNATYLSDKNSEKALAILSKVSFKDGLTQSLPEGITVAHKFGERLSGNTSHIDSIELHDCGIIYGASGPYLLCVMTKGKTLPNLTEIISDISKMVYDDVKNK